MAALGAIVAALQPRVAHADERGPDEERRVEANREEGRPAPKTERKRPRIMREPGEVVDVIDAFDSDNDDPFDFQFTLGFNYLSKRARILRESAVFEPGLTTGGFTARTMNVGQYIRTTSILTPRVDFGLYKDLALYASVPIVIADEQRIEGRDGSEANTEIVAAGAPGEGQLFSLPFKSPKRSGVKHVAIGVDWGVFNQQRDSTKPTWVIGAETRISAGTPMHACDAGKDPSCPHHGDINQDGQFDPNNKTKGGTELESVSLSNRTAGVTRGTIALELHSAMSKRIKYIEAYGGLNALFEFQLGKESDYGATDLEGALVNHPPLVGTVMVGMMIHPWENREKFGRLTFDLRFEGSYHSEGRDYSELFDALGSSKAKSLRSPKWARFRPCNPAECPVAKPGEDAIVSVVDESSQKTYFTGLSVVEAFGSYRASGSVTWRIAEYVKLNFGLGLQFEQAHGITHDQPCNPNIKRASEAGPCKLPADLAGNIGATGLPNPAYRPTVNAVGRRFYVDDSITYEIFAKGVVMF
jgi:hypothetical protein